MHLKNFSLITRGSKVELRPAYDLLNTTITTGKAVEEMALPLGGKKNRINGKLLFEYYAAERMSLNKKTIDSEIQNITNKNEALKKLIGISFLSTEMKNRYLELFNERYERLMS